MQSPKLTEIITNQNPKTSMIVCTSTVLKIVLYYDIKPFEIPGGFGRF
jgi:hypothetical protein